MAGENATETAGGTAGRLLKLAPLLIALACAAAYSNALRTPFIFDDVSSLTENPTLRSLWPPWGPLDPPGNLTVSGRPVANLTLAVNYALGGYQPLGYHLFNLAVHILAALTLFGLVRRSLKSPGLAGAFGRDAGFIALAASLLWALHPLQTESVTYTIQRCESLAGLFYLLTLHCFLRGEGSGKAWLWRGASVAACALGMGSKEVAASAPLVVLLFDRAFVAGSFRSALEARWKYYLALAATWIILAFLVVATGNRSDTAGFGVGYAWWEYGLTQVYAVTMYLRLVFWPWPLLLDYGDSLHPLTWDFLPRALLLAGLLGASAHALVKRPALGFLGAFFFAALAPTSSVLSIRTQTIAEHRMYLALAPVVAGVLLTARAGWARWAGGRPGRAFAAPSLAVAALLLGGLTLARNAEYATEYTMAYDILKKNPANHRVHETLALLYTGDGRLEEAFAEFDETRRLKPEPDLGARLALTLMGEGKPSGAEALLRHALRSDPTAKQYNVLGVVLASRGKKAEAVEAFRRAVKLAPGSVNYWENLKRAEEEVWGPRTSPAGGAVRPQ